MNLPRLAILALSLATAPLQADLTPEQTTRTMSGTEVEKMLPKEHPSSYYLYSGRLFGEGRKDDAVFWYYVGQLRYRFYLQANPDPERSGDAALFTSLTDKLGQSLNTYAAGNVKEWVKTINRALKWDADNENGFTSKKKYRADYEEIRAGLKNLRDQVASEGDIIRAERTKAGLENRG